MHQDFCHQRVCQRHTCHFNFGHTQSNTLSAPVSLSPIFFSFCIGLLLSSKSYCFDCVHCLFCINHGEFSPQYPATTYVCNRFLHSRDNDPHLFCVTCQSKECNIDDRSETAMNGTTRCGVRWVAIILSWLFSIRGKLKLPLPLDSHCLCLFLYVPGHCSADSQVFSLSMGGAEAVRGSGYGLSCGP